MRSEYHISFDKARTAEKTIRKFLFKNSNIIRLTEIRYTELEFFYFKRHSGENDPKFLEILNNLKPAFIKKITNNQRFNDLPQGEKAKFNHYFYQLTPELKATIDQETLLWNFAPPNSKHFYCLEDPTFYQDNTMTASIITHEPIITLYLTDLEKIELSKNRVEFD